MGMRAFYRPILCAAVLVLTVTPVRAQYAVGDSFPVATVYIKLKPSCGDDSMTPAQQYKLAASLWTRSPGQGDTENMHICAVRAALRGYGPAQALLGELYSYSRTLAFDGVAPPLHTDTAAAVYWFQAAAANGDARGTFLLGRMYEMGGGVTQDDATAVGLYEKAARTGYGSAITALKALQSRDSRAPDFIARYQSKAAAGDPEAMRAYAEAYIKGDPFRADLKTAAQWMQKAGLAGDKQAMSMMGDMYLSGYGVARNRDQAVDWLLKAAHAGDHKRDWWLIGLHDSGRISATQVTAIEQASTNGVLRDAITVIHKLTVGPRRYADDGSLVTPVMADVPFNDLMRRAREGDAKAQVNLAIRYLDGTGVAADPAAARTWLAKAAQQNADANMNLGDLAYAAQPPDLPAAAEFYATAGIMEDSIGARNAAAIYQTLNEPKQAYAMALALDGQDGAMAEPVFARLDPVLSFEDRARALQALCEKRLAHYSWFK